MTEHANDQASVLTVYCWDGTAWTSVGTDTDETEIGGNSLSASGFISWNAPNREEEFPQNLFGMTNDKKTAQPDPEKPDWYNELFPDKILKKAGMKTSTVKKISMIA